MKDQQASYPQLRFKGFTDPWEERKLSSGLREYTDRVIVEDDKEYSQISVRNNFGGITLRGSKMGNKIGRKRQAKINLTKYPQTLIFTRQTVEQGGIGWVDKYCDGAIVTENMPTISLDTSVFSKYFLTNLFQTRIFYKNAILDNVEGGSAQIAIHESKFLSSTLLFPNLDEQEKIGKFFKQLDKTIALHQRKLAKLKELKQGYLQKLFPKNGSKFPQLRFAGFADAWEERKLTEIVNRVNKSSNSDVLPKVEFEDIVSGEGRLNKDISSKFDSRKGTLFEPENILYGKLRPYLKNWLFPEFEGVALGDFWVFEATDVSVPSFDYYLIQSDNYQKVANDTSGTKMPRSDWKSISSTDFSIPSKDEQKQIGAFFKQLDDTITLHQRKLEKLQELKKGYLQKMFC